jgi:hypothetical protein
LLGAFPFHTFGDIILASGRRPALRFSVLGMVMEGHSAAFGRCADMPYQDIAAGSLHSSQQHPAYYRGVTLPSVRAVARAVSEARICLTALLAA